MSLLGAASTAAANALAHTITFAINLAIFTNMCHWLFNKGKKQAFYVMIIATVLIMVDLTRHVLMDAKVAYVVDVRSSKRFHIEPSCDYQVTVNMNSDGCSLSKGQRYTIEEVLAVPGSENWSMYDENGDLTSVGWFITVICTWSGVILMFIAVWLGLKKNPRRSSPSTEPLL
jgi:hypothetical protein